MRSDRTRTAVNQAVMSRVRTAEKQAVAKPPPESLAKLYSTVDVAVKKRVLKLNTASRIKAGIVRHTRAKLTKSPFTK